MAELRKRIAAARASARELTDHGMKPAEIAQVFRLPEGAVRDLLSDAPNLSPATMRALAARKPRRA
jgi:DNA-directed RNA polymerase specialized sigma24 family protein